MNNQHIRDRAKALSAIVLFIFCAVVGAATVLEVIGWLRMFYG